MSRSELNVWLWTMTICLTTVFGFFCWTGYIIYEVSK